VILVSVLRQVLDRELEWVAQVVTRPGIVWVSEAFVQADLSFELEDQDQDQGASMLHYQLYNLEV
jgi:hypothetical protein